MKITVVDARMGRGKTSAAIRYMNQLGGEKCFLYITPYLSEVSRVCDLCGCEEPDSDCTSKSIKLKELMRRRRNIAATHSLFTIMDDEALTLARENGYNLIIDESPPVIQGVAIGKDDKDDLLNNLVTMDESGVLTWRQENYKGVFSNYKRIADDGALRYCGGTLYEVMNPNRFLSFGEVFVLTYLFDGQLLKAYFDYHGFDYRVVGVERDGEGYCFSDRPDEPDPVDYSDLLRIEELDQPRGRMNKVGMGRTALSMSWFSSRYKNHADIKAIRNGLYTFFERRTESKNEQRLWTTYKTYAQWILGDRNRFRTSFLSLNAKATNAYRDKDCVAYLANRFVDPNIAKFFASRGIKIDPDRFALSEMIQFIWRSAIRDNQPIQLYIPSRRMRDLLTDWMRSVSTEGVERVRAA